MDKKLASAILNSRVFVNKPGTFRMKVTSVQLVDGKYIVNVNAITPYHKEVIDEAIAKGDLDAACNSHLSANVFINASFVPAKGQTVLAEVDQITTKNGVNGLFIMSVAPVPVEATIKAQFDLSSIADDTTEEPVAIEIANEEEK
jgi:hypothetical protein